LGKVPIETWAGNVRRGLQAHVADLIGHTYWPPSRAELLLLSSTVLPTLEAADTPSDWPLAVAAQLGYHVARAEDERQPGWILFEPRGSDRRGNATLVVRPEAPRALSVEVPAPLWELGTLSYGLALFDTSNARHLLLAGARPNARDYGSSDPRRAAGRTSYFQHIHETMLAAGNDVVAVHAIHPDVPITQDVILESSAPVLSAAQRTRLSEEMIQVLSDGGLDADHYAATPNQVSIGAQFDPAFAFAERFAPEKMLRLWFAAGTRERITRVPAQLASFRRIVNASALELDLASMSIARITAARPLSEPGQSTRACNLDQVTRTIEQWLIDDNPYDRLDAKRIGAACEWHAAIDAPTGNPWLVLLSRNAARLVPLHDIAVAGKRLQVHCSEDRLRRALDLGANTLVVECR